MYFYTLAYTCLEETAVSVSVEVGTFEYGGCKVCLCFSKPTGRLRKSGFGADRRADVVNV